jgi:hypothetical protein
LLTDDLASGALEHAFGAARPLKELQIDPDSSGVVGIPDAELMFQGEYRREGFDLVIENETTRLIVDWSAPEKWSSLRYGSEPCGGLI